MRMEQLAGNGRKKIAAALLPEEIVVEILSWCEVKSLLRFKCVCKRWYAIIQHRKFAETRMKTRGTFHYIKSRDKTCNLDGIKERYKCRSACDGFLLERRSFYASVKPSIKFRVCNPSTKQIFDLPDPQNKVFAMFIYLKSSENVVYNVVSVSAEKRNLKLEVMELGNGPRLAWRTLNIRKFNPHIKKGMYHNYKMSTDHGIMYLCTIVPAGSSNAEIICVDLDKEACTTCVVPQRLHSNWKGVTFVMWNDKPSLLAVVKETINIRVLEDYKKQKWAGANIIISLPCFKRCPDMKTFKVRVHNIGGKDVLVYTDNTIWFKYKVISNTWCEKTFSEVSTFRLRETFVILK